MVICEVLTKERVHGPNLSYHSFLLCFRVVSGFGIVTNMAEIEASVVLVAGFRGYL